MCGKRQERELNMLRQKRTTARHSPTSRRAEDARGYFPQQERKMTMKHVRTLSRKPEPAADVSIGTKIDVVIGVLSALSTVLEAKYSTTT
jgi:hypothetical protein